MDKEYHLNTVGEIMEIINQDNLDNFIVDFKAFLQLTINKKNINTVLKEIVDVEIIRQNDEFHWIDDNKNDITITTTIIEE